jgi:hypothetical protein
VGSEGMAWLNAKRLVARRMDQRYEPDGGHSAICWVLHVGSLTPDVSITLTHFFYGHGIAVGYFRREGIDDRAVSSCGLPKQLIFAGNDITSGWIVAYAHHGRTLSGPMRVTVITFTAYPRPIGVAPVPAARASGLGVGSPIFERTA